MLLGGSEYRNGKQFYNGGRANAWRLQMERDKVARALAQAENRKSMIMNHLLHWGIVYLTLGVVVIFQFVVLPMVL